MSKGEALATLRGFVELNAPYGVVRDRMISCLDVLADDEVGEGDRPEDGHRRTVTDR